MVGLNRKTSMLALKPHAVNVKPHAHQAIHSRPERFVKNIAIADLAAPPLFEIILGIAEIDPLQALFDGILNGVDEVGGAVSWAGRAAWAGAVKFGRGVLWLVDWVVGTVSTLFP